MDLLFLLIKKFVLYDILVFLVFFGKFGEEFGELSLEEVMDKLEKLYVEWGNEILEMVN